MQYKTERWLMEWCQLNAGEDPENNPSKCLQQVAQPGTNNLLGVQLKDWQCRQKLTATALPR